VRLKNQETHNNQRDYLSLFQLNFRQKKSKACCEIRLLKSVYFPRIAPYSVFQAAFFAAVLRRQRRRKPSESKLLSCNDLYIECHCRVQADESQNSAKELACSVLTITSINSNNTPLLFGSSRKAVQENTHRVN
jgi:hypothetical protein